MLMCNKTCLYVRDNALIGEFKDAVETTIWRMDLGRINAVSFKVVHTGSTWDLGMEGGKGDFTAIASFDSQGKANRALRRIACALRNRGWIRRLFHALLTLVLLVVAYFIFGFAFFSTEPKPPVVQQGQSTSADTALRPPATVRP